MHFRFISFKIYTKDFHFLLKRSIVVSCSAAVMSDSLQSMDCVLHYLPEFAQIHVHRLGLLSNHLILCCPILLLCLIFPSIRGRHTLKIIMKFNQTSGHIT